MSADNMTPSPFHQNEYGGTIGGPIFKDQAFFFFSYQGYHQRDSAVLRQHGPGLHRRSP